MKVEPRTRLTIDDSSDGKLSVLLELTLSNGDEMTFKMRPPRRDGEGIGALQSRMLEEARSRIDEMLALQRR